MSHDRCKCAIVIWIIYVMLCQSFDQNFQNCNLQILYFPLFILKLKRSEGNDILWENIFLIHESKMTQQCMTQQYFSYSWIKDDTSMYVVFYFIFILYEYDISNIYTWFDKGITKLANCFYQSKTERHRRL